MTYNCPIHNVPMRHFPNDSIRQWECPRCGIMFTTEWLEKNWNSETIERIRAEHRATESFRANVPARRIAEQIQAIQDRAEEQNKKLRESAEGVRTLGVFFRRKKE